MNTLEQLIHFQNKAEQNFQEKKTFRTLVNYGLALILFVLSTLISFVTLPVRVLTKKKAAGVVSMNVRNVEDVLRREPLVLIDFWAEWCGPCVMMNPTIEEFAATSSTVCVAKVNADTNRELIKRFNVRGIPQLLLIKDGQEIKRHAGPMTLRDLERFCVQTSEG